VQAQAKIQFRAGEVLDQGEPKTGMWHTPVRMPSAAGDDREAQMELPYHRPYVDHAHLRLMRFTTPWESPGNSVLRECAGGVARAPR
jgi:hypothetical protein